MAGERRFADVEGLGPAIRAAPAGTGSCAGWSGWPTVGRKAPTASRWLTAARCFAWNDSEDYWQGSFQKAPTIRPTRSRIPSGLTPFESAARRLASAGVRCPEILFADRSRTRYPADIALVEDVAGGSLEALLEN